jgi:hypothetical protein
MAKSVGIIGYGTPEDRLKLEALAKLAKTSASQWLIQQIRDKYKEIFGTDEVAHVKS